MLTKVAGILYVFASISCLISTAAPVTADRRLSKGKVAENVPVNAKSKGIQRANTVDLDAKDTKKLAEEPKFKRAQTLDLDAKKKESLDDLDAPIKTFLRQQLRVYDDANIKDAPEKKVTQVETVESVPEQHFITIESDRMMCNRYGHTFTYKKDIETWLDKNDKPMLRKDGTPMTEEELGEYGAPEEFEEIVVVKKDSKKPKPVGNREFEQAAEMEFCLGPLVNNGIFKDKVIENPHLAHRLVRGFKAYEDQAGIKTCYIEVEVKRGTVCAFKSKAVNIKGDKGPKTYDQGYILRFDSAAPCAEYLTGKNYEVEPTGLNPIYKLVHPSGKDDLLDHQKEIFNDFVEMAKYAKLFKDAKYNYLNFDSLSLTYADDYLYSVVLKSAGKECKIEQKKVDIFNSKFFLAPNSPPECSQVINGEDEQHSFIPTLFGDWQRLARDDFKQAVGDFLDTNPATAVLNVNTKDIKSITDSSKDATSGIIIEVVVGAKTCSLAKAKGNGQAWTATPNDADCKKLLKGRRVRV